MIQKIPALERMLALSNELRETKQQRDQLLEALKGIEQVSSYSDIGMMPRVHWLAEAALAAQPEKQEVKTEWPCYKCGRLHYGKYQATDRVSCAGRCPSDNTLVEV